MERSDVTNPEQGGGRGWRLRIIGRLPMLPMLPMMAMLPAMMATMALGLAACDGMGEERIDVTNPKQQGGKGWRYEYDKDAGGVIAISANGSYRLTGGSTDKNRVEVAWGVKCTITLDNCHIRSDKGSPLSLNEDGCDVTLRLIGDNGLAATGANSDGNGYSGIAGWGNLTIEGNRGATGLATEGGSLTAIGGDGGRNSNGYSGRGGCGISVYGNIGNLTISGGNVTATGGDGQGDKTDGYGGGGIHASGNLSINGSNVTAKGGEGFGGWGVNITDFGIVGITGGGGHGIFAGSLSISGDVITAKGGDGFGGRGIGNGHGGSGIIVARDISISGGNVKATGGRGYDNIADNNDNIGKGGDGIYGDNLSISGGHVIANTIIGHPLSISGAETLVEADSVNTTDFGGATVRLKKR